MTKEGDMAIKKFIKENFTPVEDKPGYVWFSKENVQIINIETLYNAIVRLIEESEDKA